MTTSRRSQQSMFGDGLEPRATLWRTPSSQEPGVNPERLVDKDGNRPTHFNQRLYDRETGRMAQHSLTQDVVIAGFSPQATRASRSATPGSGPERMTPGTSGRGFIDCLPDFRTNDRIGWFSRTFVGTSAWGSTVCSMTWKASATPRGRSLYLLRVSARSTGGTGCGSSEAEAMWPTPQTANVSNDVNVRTASQRAPHHPPNKLGWAVAERLWPTPRAGKRDGEDEEKWKARRDRGDVSMPPLGLAVKMWPTPRASEQEARTTKRTPSQEGGKHGLYLSAEAAEADRAAGSYQTGQKLNPDFVQRLMGFPSGWTVLSEPSDADGSTACR